jgi:biopolymer transport protein ExbD
MTARPPLDVDEAKPDMTPMIDVVFLMIVFFVCIDFRVLEAKLPAFLPKDAGSSPTAVEPQEQLSVRVHVVAPGTKITAHTADAAGVDRATGRPPRYRLDGHRVAWEVGPRRFDDLAAAAAELARIAADPANHAIDPRTGERGPIACVVEGQRGARYGDVATAADACRAAGFTRIQFGGGLGAD